MGRISALTELTELSTSDYLVVLDSSANIAKKISVANAFGVPDFGYTAAGETWTYASATTITVPSDATTKYAEGMILKFTQSTGGTKYAVIDTVASTLLTVTMLDSATLENEAITAPFYSSTATPVGVGKVGPERRTGGFAMGVISAATFGSTGVKNITGLGFKPKLVEFMTLPSSSTTQMNISWGAMSEDGTQHYATINDGSSPGPATRLSGTNKCIRINGTGSITVNMEAQFSSMNADGFSINVTTAGVTFDVGWKAYA